MNSKYSSYPILYLISLFDSYSDSGSFGQSPKKSIKTSKLSKDQSEKEYMKLLAEEYNFTLEEVSMIKHRFLFISSLPYVLDSINYQKTAY